MKHILVILIAICFFAHDIHAQQYKVVTAVESIVPLGLGRSRLIAENDNPDLEGATRERTDGTHSDMRDVKRRDLKIDNFEETKLLNYYSAVGINFQNIASNDAIITEKLNQLASNGWELVFVTSGVESDAGEPDGHGIFITRFIFKK